MQNIQMYVHAILKEWKTNAAGKAEQLENHLREFSHLIETVGYI